MEEYAEQFKTKEKLNISLEEYTGGYEEYGIITRVNGVEMPFRNTDTNTILEMVLKHLGYEVDITNLD